MTNPTARAVLTVVSAKVEPSRHEELVAGFQDLLAQPKPDGLLRTELLHDGSGQWQVQTLWRDRDALDAMRRSAEPPAAPTLLRAVGGEPTLTVLEVAAQFGTS